jgi:hypothetical protein
VKWFSIALFVLFALFLGGIKLMLGGGMYYPDISSPPNVSDDRISAPIQLPFPAGMVASAPDGRLFYTYHSLHQPQRFSDATVFEWVNGQGVPFPNLESQKYFDGAMGITIDHQDRFWIINPGAEAGTRLMAFDINTSERLVDHLFQPEESGFSQDLRVSRDGNTVYLADTGLLSFLPAQLIIFDVPTLTSRAVLTAHPSVAAQDWIIRKPDGADYKLLFGLITFTIGVDGIALSHDDQWIYYGAISHERLYRIPTSALRDETLSPQALAQTIELVGTKPLSDGIELLADNTVILTDIENGGIAALSPAGELSTMVKRLTDIDWADSVTVAPDGSIWFTDSRLTDLINQLGGPASMEEIAAGAPYSIYRVSP